MIDAAPAVHVFRNGVTESLHYAAVAVVQSDGTLVYSLGDPDSVTFLRSSAKPFQALPIIESGAFDHFGFGPRELAVMCASHSGQSYHVECVQGILDRIGKGIDDLRCGVHAPIYGPAARALEEAGQAPTAIHNNCSGKHAGMLALSVYLGLDHRDYLSPDHPVQQLNKRALADLAGVDPDDIPIAVDGCGVPTFALPLRLAAVAFARLLDPFGFEPGRVRAIERIVDAMRGYPEMVAGDERLDTWLMQTAPNLVTKGGAEGFQGIGVLRDGQEVLGIAVKISDGDVAGRAKSPVVLETLAQTESVSPDIVERGSQWHYGVVYNRHHANVADVRPVFTLQAASV
ncbi:MAG: asparaginase [Anaerolineae bacterium]